MDKKNLFLLIDTSSSMWDRDLYSGEKKIEILKDKLLKYLSDDIDKFENTFFYTFSSNLKFQRIIKSRDELENKLILHMDSGSTRIWDSINEIIEIINRGSTSILGSYFYNKNVNNLILCITDGDDNSSRITFEELIKKIEDIKNIELKIIDLSSKIKIKTEKKSRVSIGNDLDEIKNIGNNSNKAPDYNFSVCVIPAIPVTSGEVDLIRRMTMKAIPYIEKLTGLRYYPVPTLIVDEYIIRDYVDVVKETDNDLNLNEDIKEFIKFILAVSISFHVGAFIPDNLRELLKKTEYEGLHALNREAVEKLRMWAETAYGLYNFFNNDSEEFYNFGRNDDWYIEEISEIKDPVISCYDDLKCMRDILKNIQERYKEVGLSDSYFCDGRDYPDLEVWRKYISSKQFEKLIHCINNRGEWKKDLKSILYALDLAIEIVFKILARMRKKVVKYSNIISNIHTFGVYFSPTEEINKKIKDKLILNGYPDYFNLNNTGIVCLCLDRIKERINETLSTEPSLNEAYLKENLILATLIHEHTHAAVYEGLNFNSNNITFSSTRNNGKKFKAVSEGLAEWTELNYFRNDKFMFDIVMNHALSGNFPDWPYAAACLIEKSFDKLGDIKYKALVEYFRKDYNEAYQLLTLVKKN